MTIREIEARIPVDAAIVLDTSVLISFLGGAEPASEAAQLVLERLVATERNPAVISAVTVTEIMVGAIKAGPEAESMARAFVLSYPGLSIRSVDVLVAADAAAIRATTRLPVPDSIVLATAVMAGSPVVITNDRDLASKAEGVRSGIDVLLLSELAA
jgi:predicted nucleic acid-binding protein